MGRHRSPGRVSAAAIAVVSLLLLLFSSGHSFPFLPRVAPRDFQKGDELQVKMDELSSVKTQLHYDFNVLKYCKPSHEIQNVGELNPGEDLHRTENSVYNFRMREDQSCKVACISHLNAQSAKDFKDKIDDEYRANMILDDLPVTKLVERHKRFGYPPFTKYDYGFRIGFKGNSSESNEEKHFIHNHLSFRVMFHKDPETDSAQIVGFEVSPISLNHEYKGRDEHNNPIVPTCNQHTENLIQAITIPQEIDEDKQIVFTYDVTFTERDIKWASRWDTYVSTHDGEVHWATLFGGLFYSFIGAIFIVKLLPHRDIAKYNYLDTQIGNQWKHLHGDVFRSPSKSGLLSVYVGTGVQILAMTLVTMILALLGFLSPSNLGGVMISDVVPLWAVIMGLSSGYSSARLSKMFKVTKWKSNALKTALMFPVILFSVLFVRNALLREKKSTRAVPIGTMFDLACSWLKMFAPCVCLGSCFGFKRLAVTDPVKTNDIPRKIPMPSVSFLMRLVSIVAGGMIPIMFVGFELKLVLKSVWVDKFYNLFGFTWLLCIVFVGFIVVSAEVAIVCCYCHLSTEDYDWWWTSYFASGMSAVYVFLYSVIFFFTDLEINNVVSVIVYFGCMLVASFALFMMTGAVGFYACLWFVRKLYSTLKVD